jgi:hypothetical protein
MADPRGTKAGALTHRPRTHLDRGVFVRIAVLAMGLPPTAQRSGMSCRLEPDMIIDESDAGAFDRGV